MRNNSERHLITCYAGASHGGEALVRSAEYVNGKGACNMEKALKKVLENKALSLALRILSHFVTVLSIAAFGYLAVISAKESISLLFELGIILGAPFFLVTLLRKRINAPRPYEIYDFYPTPPKNKEGLSFPSRHAFSAFAIGTALCFISPLTGGTLLALGVLMCAARVLLGIHFIRDVLTGAVVGIVTTLIGKLIFCYI